MGKKYCLNIFISLLLYISLLHYSIGIIYAYGSDVNVSATIGGGTTFSLYGYTSPKSTVTMSSQGIYDETRSDSDGYFLFNKKPSSLYHQELCLFAQDELGRVSTPICIPALPSEEDAVIGPIILPPTVSLNNGSLFIGEEPILSGQTIPNTNLKLSLFTDESKNNQFIAFKALVSPVEAYTIPKISITSDSKGNYSIALPSSQSTYYRMFAQSFYQESLSPKSNTLHLGIMPFWTYVLQLFGFLWKSLQRYLLDFIIMSQIIAVGVFFLRRFFHPYRLFQLYRRSKHYPLAIRPIHELKIEYIPLMKRPVDE